MIKLGVVTLGCDKNRVDTEKLIAIALNVNGVELTNESQDADVILINTCAFIEDSTKESIETIFEMAEIKKTKDIKIIVCGCFAVRYFDAIKNEMSDAVDYIVQVQDYEYFEKIILDIASGNDIKEFHGTVQHAFLSQQMERIITTPSHYAYLKIADGCSNHCTYCSIPSIRGSYISSSIENIIDEAKKLIDTYGVKELNIVAQDVTRYGKDLYNEYKLTTLLDKLTQLDVDWIRLNYCYPELIDDKLIDIVANNDKIVKYFDIPMQHSDDSILKLMNRHSSNSSLKRLIENIRNANSDISIRSTFIVGFPRETDEQFNNLIDFLKFAQLDNAGFFAYSKEDGTAAAKLSGQISKSIKKTRLSIVQSVQTRIMENKMKEKINKTLKVLCDDIDYDRQMFVGRLQGDAPSVDKKVYFTSKDLVAVGEFNDVKITKINKLDYIGEKQ